MYGRSNLVLSLQTTYLTIPTRYKTIYTYLYIRLQILITNSDKRYLLKVRDVISDQIVAKTLFGFVLLLCVLRCKCMIIFSEIITSSCLFLYFTCQCQNKRKNRNIKCKKQKKIYTLNKILPYGSLPYY